VLSINRTVKELEGIRPDSVPPEVLESTDPLVLRGFALDWPLVRAARSGKADGIAYLREHARDQEVLVFRGKPEIGGRFFYNEDFSGFNFDRASTRLRMLLDEFDTLGEGVEEPSLYLGSTPFKRLFPGIAQEYDIDLGDINTLVSVWMGNRTRVAAHFDYPDNIACVAAGCRRFILFPPDQLANLYVGPIDFTPAGQPISLVDFYQPDFERYPRFRVALEAAQVAEMEPGDAILIPSMWWHQVEGLDSFNVLVNYWWRTLSPVRGLPMDALVHAILCMNGLPPAQLAAWRTVFEHYVFANTSDSECFSHIPQGSRGILSAIDDQTARQLRAMLSAKLGS